MPINDESQIYSKLVVIGFSCIPTHFVLRISVLERQAEGLALSFWRVCTCFHFVWTASCLQAQNGHMLIDSHPHTVRKVGAGGRENKTIEFKLESSMVTVPFYKYRNWDLKVN